MVGFLLRLKQRPWRTCGARKVFVTWLTPVWGRGGDASVSLGFARGGRSSTSTRACWSGRSHRGSVGVQERGRHGLGERDPGGQGQSSAAAVAQRGRKRV